MASWTLGAVVTVVAFNDPVPFNPDALSVSASLRQISPLARINYSIPQSSEYSFIGSLVDTHSRNLIGSNVPHLSTKAIRFSVLEPKGIQTLAVPLGLMLLRCSRQSRACPPRTQGSSQLLSSWPISWRLLDRLRSRIGEMILCRNIRHNDRVQPPRSQVTSRARVT